ncbi:MAG: hypothetical protein KDA92_02070 [Planctomycetales bacterium]|nr:hypothetical protein [Planctomycetales bacterium]MCA9166799.1 hypothetical protein [Planctomycetales bacterium]
MTIRPDAVEVRSIVRRIFSEMGVAQRELDEISETILLDEGRIRARSYRLDDLMAMWMLDIGIVQFYDADGNMVRRANLLSEIHPRPVRLAA